MEYCEMGENSNEMINKLTRQLEHSRDLNDLFLKFVDVENLNVPNEIKELIKEKAQVCKTDKEQ